MTTFDTGRKAEAAAAAWLEVREWEIIERNWRTRWCEIDIIAQKNQTIVFCEVKYRVTNRQGSGLDYITPKKLQQMRFAAEFWVHSYNWRGEYELGAVEVAGKNFQITNAIREL